MKIDSLATSITEMSPKESYEFILALRKRRRLAPTLTPTKQRKSSTKKPNVDKLLANLTPAQAATLIEALGGN